VPRRRVDNMSMDIDGASATPLAGGRWPVLLAIVVLIAGLALTWLASRVLFDAEGERGRARLEEQASSTARQLQLAIDLSLASLHSARTYVEAGGPVEFAGFSRFVVSDAEGRNGLLALGLASRVPHRERAAFEQWLSAQRARTEHIFEETGHGVQRAVPYSPEYFPVRLLVSQQGDALQSGLDMNAVPARRDAIRSTLATGAPAALKARRADVWGIDGDLVIQAFERVNPAQDHVSDAGVGDGASVVIGIFSVGAIFRKVFDSARDDVQVAVFDLSSPAPEQRLFARNVEGDPRSAQEYVDRIPAGEPMAEKWFRFANRSWVMFMLPGPDDSLVPDPGLPLAGIVIGVLVTALLALYLFIALARGRQLSWLNRRLAGMQQDLLSEQVGAAMQRSLREQADAAARARSHFLQAASHDVRQPLHALGLYLNLLGERPQLSADRSFMARLRSAADGLQGLFDGLLDLGRLESGQLQPSPRGFDIAPLLQRLCDEGEALAQRRCLRLFRHIEPARVESDPLLLERVVRNLLVNALRYTESGWVALRCTVRNGRARVQVFDSGPGIARDARGHLFEPHVHDRHGGDGVGLGLAIVGQMCALLHHPVSVRSRAGRGSIFTVGLPLESRATARAPEAAPLPGGQAGLAGCRLWLVEDDAKVRDATLRQLRNWQADVTVAASVADARSRFATGAVPDCIVLDQQLPDGLGIDLLREWRARSGVQLPALLMTGDTAPDADHARGEAGVVVLRKPVTALKLRSALNVLLAGSASPR
jgi:signal transduction histidine kinase/CheY-like chemotaxis protein